MLCKMLILLLHCTQHSVAVYSNSINIVEYGCLDIRICALLNIISNVVNLILALHSALCDSILAIKAFTLCYTDLMINAFVHCCLS